MKTDIGQVAREMQLDKRPTRGRRYDFSRFVEATDPAWEKLATFLHRRWPLPYGIGIEDVKQDMLLGAWRKLPMYDPSRASFGDYVIFHGMDFATKRIHKQRGAILHGNAGKNPSRHPYLMRETRLQNGVTCDNEAGLSLDTASNHNVIRRGVFKGVDEVDNVLDIAHACITDRERLIIRALAESGDVRDAADVLYDSLPHWHLFKFESQAHARRLVRDIVVDLRSRLATYDTDTE